MCVRGDAEGDARLTRQTRPLDILWEDARKLEGIKCDGWGSDLVEGDLIVVLRNETRKKKPLPLVVVWPVGAGGVVVVVGTG